MASDHYIPVETGDCPRSIRELFRRHITVEEETEIKRQFDNTVGQTKGLVLWSGIPRHDAENWAAKRGLCTLAMAMGPLMGHGSAGNAKRSPRKLQEYMRGASVIFTWYAVRNQTVIALTPPPPERFHPSGGTNFQAAEVPVIIECARLRLEHVRVMLLHPTVKGAEDSSYQIWPIDKTETWTSQYGTNCPREVAWRSIKMLPGRPRLAVQPTTSTPNTEVYVQLVHLFLNLPRDCHKSNPDIPAVERIAKVNTEHQKTSIVRSMLLICQAGSGSIMELMEEGKRNVLIILPTSFLRYLLYIMLLLLSTLLSKKKQTEETGKIEHSDDPVKPTGSKMAKSTEKHILGLEEIITTENSKITMLNKVNTKGKSNTIGVEVKQNVITMRGQKPNPKAKPTPKAKALPTVKPLPEAKTGSRAITRSNAKIKPNVKSTKMVKSEAKNTIQNVALKGKSRVTVKELQDVMAPVAKVTYKAVVVKAPKGGKLQAAVKGKSSVPAKDDAGKRVLVEKTVMNKNPDRKEVPMTKKKKKKKKKKKTTTKNRKLAQTLVASTNEPKSKANTSKTQTQKQVYQGK